METSSHKYAKWVNDHPLLVCKYIKLSVKRFNKDLKRDDIYFDEVEAEKVVKWAESNLVLWEGEWRGENVKLFDWQRFVLQNIFAWKYKKNDKRKHQTVYIQIARKNGKTTFADIITAIHVFRNGEKTPQVLVGANNEDQAKICTNSLGKILEISPNFRDAIDDGEIRLFRYKDRIHTINYQDEDKDATIFAMSKEPGTKDGFNPSLGIIDEYHEAKDDSLLNVISTGQGARREPLLIVITTAGFRKDGPCYSKLRKSSIDILEGRSKDDTHFSVIYEQDTKDEMASPDTWIKSNPMIEHFDTIRPFLEKEKTKAVNEGGTKETSFCTKNLNMWMDAIEVWIADNIWVANHNPKLVKDDLKGLECYGGLDLGQTRDLTAFSLFFPNAYDLKGVQKHATLNWSWIPEDNISERGHDYSQYVRDGSMFATDGNYGDHTLMSEFIIETSQDYKMIVTHFDRYLTELVAALLSKYITVESRAMGGYILNMAMKELERIVLAKELEHFNNPVLRWSMQNLLPKTDPNGNIRPDKSNPANKIDPSVALILAVDAWMVNKAKPKKEARVIMLS